jgi:hypothetical protein
MTKLNKAFLRIKLFFGIKKITPHLKALLEGSPNKPYAFWFNSVLDKAQNLKKISVKKVGLDNQIKRMKEIMNNSEHLIKNKSTSKITNFDIDALKSYKKEKYNAQYYPSHSRRSNDNEKVVSDLKESLDKLKNDFKI